MESNGKSVRWDGSAVTTDTGEIFYGSTACEWAFQKLTYQMFNMPISSGTFCSGSVVAKCSSTA
jgi:glucose-6-phosphate isomerase